MELTVFSDVFNYLANTAVCIITLQILFINQVYFKIYKIIILKIFSCLICGLQLPRKPHQSTNCATEWLMAARRDNVISFKVPRVN